MKKNRTLTGGWCAIFFHLLCCDGSLARVDFRMCYAVRSSTVVADEPTADDSSCSVAVLAVALRTAQGCKLVCRRSFVSIDARLTELMTAIAACVVADAFVFGVVFFGGEPAKPAKQSAAARKGGDSRRAASIRGRGRRHGCRVGN